MIDVAINYYGKPYQTMVTIASLLEHSGAHIDKVYLILEPQQPEGGDLIHDLLKRHDWPIKKYVPKLYLGWGNTPDRARLTPWMYRLPRVRRSLRYQYALEKSNKRYVLLTHNDMRFTDDVVAPLVRLASEGGRAGVGDIGACWKCPAEAAGICVDRNYSSVALTPEEWEQIYLDYPSPYRVAVAPSDLLNRPLPPQPSPPIECRLNEWLALIDVASYRRDTRAGAEPIGSNKLGDTGIAWYRDMVHRGYSFAHYDQGFIHGHWSENWAGGHRAMFDAEKYAAEESAARAYYEERYAAL